MPAVRIVGTGVAGLTLALALRQAGIEDIELSAAGTQPGKDPGLILSANATRILNALGIGQALAENCIEPSLMVERAWRSGYLLTQRPLGNFARQRYGAAHVVIKESVLEGILRSQLDTYAVITDGRGAVPSDGEHIVVGCDGPASPVRLDMGYPLASAASSHSLWRASVNAANVPGNIDATSIATWMGPGQIIRHWPSAEPETIELLAIIPSTVEHFTEAFQNWHPALRQLIQHSHARQTQAIPENPPISQWYHGNHVLLGDACHLVHPYLQQSTALAMEDAWVLARMLDRWEEEVATAFHDYERYRKARINRVRAEAQSRWDEATLPRGIGAQRRNLRISLTNRFLPEMAMHQLDWLYGYDCISGFD